MRQAPVSSIAAAVANSSALSGRSAAVGSPAARGSRPMSSSTGATAMSKAPAERRWSSRAASITWNVQGSTATGCAHAAPLRRATSLVASWKLMRRCTLATASKAASIAACVAAGAAPATAISTKVPSSGRARRVLFEPGCNGHDPLHAFGHMVRRQSGAGNVADVAADLQRAAAGFSDELREPARRPDLAAVRLAILQDLHAADSSARVERNGIIDVEMLSDHPVENEEALGVPA